MQSTSPAVCLNMQSYSDGKSEMGAPGLRGALGAQIQQVKDYVLWSLFNFAFANFCCLGFVALVFSVKSRDRKVVGDVESASSYGKTAMALNIAAMALSLLCFVIVVSLVISASRQ